MKKIKWLDMLIGDSTFSDEFLQEFDRQMKSQFEAYFGMPMNWKRLWFYVEPIDRDVVIVNEFLLNGIKRTRLNTAEIRCGQMGIPCNIYWESQKEDRFFHSSEKISPGDIKIVLESAEESYWKHRFPGIDDKLSLNILNYDTYFPAVMEGPHFSHEGYIEIQTEDMSILSAIGKSFSESNSRWNDDAIEITTGPVHRGIFHDLYLDSQEEGKLIFYFDGGSAMEGAHQYFLEQLSSDVKEIKKVVVRPI